MKNIIFGELGGYIANRAIENEKERLNEPEAEPEVAPRPSARLAGPKRPVQAFYRHFFKANPHRLEPSGK